MAEIGTTMGDDRYVPALRFNALTRLYDPLVRVTTRETQFKRRLLAQAGLKAGDRILDLGCGTGTLAIQAKQDHPDIRIVGLDGDPEVLRSARLKAEEAGVEVDFVRGFSAELPLDAQSFDVVLSTLFFHHLTSAAKARTAGEVARVLVPGGKFHVADWGRPADPLMGMLFLGVRLLDGFNQTRDNAAGALPQIFVAAGLTTAVQTSQLRTVLGTIALYQAGATVAVE